MSMTSPPSKTGQSTAACHIWSPCHRCRRPLDAASLAGRNGCRRCPPARRPNGRGVRQRLCIHVEPLCSCAQRGWPVHGIEGRIRILEYKFSVGVLPSGQPSLMVGREVIDRKSFSLPSACARFAKNAPRLRRPMGCPGHHRRPWTSGAATLSVGTVHPSGK